MASQADDPVSSHGTLVPSLYTTVEKYCITCGKSDSINLCSRCKGVWYCNEKCQKADWRCHKLLCSKYAKVNEIEPLDDGYRAFLFRSDSLEPQIVVLPSRKHVASSFKSVIELLRKPDDDSDPPVERLTFGFSSRLKRDYIGKSNIRVTVRANYMIDGSKPNKSLYAFSRTIGNTCPPHYWAGNIVVQRIKPTSVTMADFRHTRDWFAMYPKHPFYQSFQDPFQDPAASLGLERSWNFDDIKGVVIKGDQLIEDESERYSTVTVPASHPIRGLKAKIQRNTSMISPISQSVGRPIRLFMRPTSVGNLDAGRQNPTCTPVVSLLRDLETDTNAIRPEAAFSLPKGGIPYADQALVVRIDDKDLSVDDLKALVHFSESMCGKSFRNVALAPLVSKEAAIQTALDFMSWDNYMLAFDELGIPRPQRPEKEAFIDTRGAGTPVDMNQGRGMDEDELFEDELFEDELFEDELFEDDLDDDELYEDERDH